jgi:pyrimidine-nucleoside phosphorylase
MKTEQDARDLAHELQRVGSELGRSVQCVLTDMNQPLGMAIGNAIEVVEAIETLRGQGPAALTELCLELSGRLLVLGEAASTTDEGRTRARSALEDGSALDMFRTWVETQGGDPRVADDTSLLPQAAFTREVAFREAGYVVSYDAEEVGRSAMDLGAGRSTPQDTIDPAAGVMMHARIGDAVSPGAPYVTLHTNDESSLEAAEERIHGAVRLSADPVTPPPLFHDL